MMPTSRTWAGALSSDDERRSRHFHCRAISCQTVVRSHGLRDFGRRRSRTGPFRPESQLGQWQTDRMRARELAQPTQLLALDTPHFGRHADARRLTTARPGHRTAQRVRRGAGFAGPAGGTPRYVLDDAALGGSSTKPRPTHWPRGWRDARSQIWRVRWNPTTTGRTTMWTATRTQWRSQQSWRPPTCPWSPWWTPVSSWGRHGQPTDPVRTEMTTIAWVAVAIFVGAYVLIATERCTGRRLARWSSDHLGLG